VKTVHESHISAVRRNRNGLYPTVHAESGDGGTAPFIIELQ